MRAFRKGTVWTFFLAVVPTVVLCAAAMEIGLRLMGRLPSNTTDGIFAPHGSSYRLKKDISKIAKTPVYSCTVYTNDLGFRDRRPGPRTIGDRPYDLFVGESLTFGNGLDYDQTFAGGYARLAAERGRDVVNLAIGGHYFRDQVEFLRDIMSSAAAKPSRVIICFSPLFVAGFEDGYTDIIIKDGYILEKRHWLVPYLRLRLGNSSAAYCFFRDNIRRIQARLSNYQAKYTRMQLDFFSKDNRLTKPDVIARLEKALGGLDAYIRGLGASPVYLYLPTSTDFSVEGLLKQMGEDPDRYDVLLYDRLLENHCRANGIPLIDLWPALKAAFDRGELLNFVQDPHYNAAAHRVILGEIVRGLGEGGQVHVP